MGTTQEKEKSELNFSSCSLNLAKVFLKQPSRRTAFLQIHRTQELSRFFSFFFTIIIDFIMNNMTIYICILNFL